MRKVPQSAERGYKASAEEESPADCLKCSVLPDKLCGQHHIECASQGGYQAEQQSKRIDCQGMRITVCRDQKGSQNDQRQSQKLCFRGKSVFFDDHCNQDIHRCCLLYRACYPCVAVIYRQIICRLADPEGKNSDDQQAQHGSPVFEYIEHTVRISESCSDQQRNTGHDHPEVDYPHRIKAPGHQILAYHSIQAPEPCACESYHSPGSDFSVVRLQLFSLHDYLRLMITAISIHALPAAANTLSASLSA